jgi:hypothetical protein
MLIQVILVMCAQRRPRIGISRMEVDGIQFMVAHNGLSAPRIHELAHDPDDSTIFRAAIDEVSQEHDLAIGLGMHPCCSIPPPAKVLQRNTQLLGLAVDVGNYVSDAQGPALLIFVKRTTALAMQSEACRTWATSALATRAALSATSRSRSAKSRACRARSVLTSACARARSPAVAARSASSLFARASATARLRDLPTVTVASAVASERISAMAACCYEMHSPKRWRSWDSASAASARRHREFSTGSRPENRLSTSLAGCPHRRKGSAGLSCGHSHATHRSPRTPRLLRGTKRSVIKTDTA